MYTILLLKNSKEIKIESQKKRKELTFIDSIKKEITLDI